jgi:hypothetical protein
LVGGICFAPDEQRIYLDYDIIATNYPGWGLNEIRAMSARQRQYWLKLIRWKREKRV